VRLPLLQPFPFPSTLGEVTQHQSVLWVYLQFLWEVGLPPLLWSFPLTTTFTSFPASDCWACAAAPAFSSGLVVRDFPFSPLQCSGRPALFATCLFLLLLLIIQVFFLFSLGGGWSVQGAMLIWPRVVCGILCAA
jgi:hypothetical protein